MMPKSAWSARSVGLEAALRPAVGASRRFGYLTSRRGSRRHRLVEAHGDVRAQCLLHLDRVLRCVVDERSIEMRAEADAVFGDLAQISRG